MSYHIIWTGASRSVSTAAEAVAALDDVRAQASSSALPIAVTVIPTGSEHLSPFDEGFPDCLEVGLGHPDHAFVRWMGDGGGYGYEQGREPGPAGLRFDYGGQPVYPEPNELRVSPLLARQAVLEFISTGERPTSLRWP